MRLAGMLKQDFRFQFRHGFYYIYAAVTLVYSIILRLIPEAFRPRIAADLIFSDTAVLGFFFIGGIVLLERSEQLLESLFISPLRIHEYILSKIISLGTLAFSCSVILLIVSELRDAGLIMIILTGTLLSSAIFTAMGVVISAKAKTVNQYFLFSIGFMILFLPAVIDITGIFRSRLFYIFPIRGIADLLLKANSSEDVSTLVPAYISMLAWSAVSFYAAGKTLKSSVKKRGGSESWIKL